MEAVNVLIETRGGEVHDILSDAPVNVAFINRDDVDVDAPNYMPCILGSPAMVSATFESTVVTDDIHANWLQIQTLEIPEYVKCVTDE